jgi:hypothetical protein
MKAFSKKAYAVSLAILSGVLGGALTLWLIQGDDPKQFEALKAHALCVLHLPEGSESTSASFTIRHPVAMFLVGIRPKASSEAFSLLISGDQGLVGSVSGVKARSFGLGRSMKPGTYTATLRQEIKGNGGEAVIAMEQPVYVTGWQIWSRTYVGLLALSGICVVFWRKSTHARARAFSLTAFHNLLLASVLIFVYLLFHEGGHALAQIAFGHFDLARSDFWGIHGHPHSGGTIGPALAAWQQTVISCAGPMLPTVAGFGLFVLWCCPAGRKLRSLRPMANLYFFATIAFLVVPDAICEPLYLLGFITAEGDLIGRVTESGGPAWPVKSLLWGIFLISAVILWRSLPEVWRSWKAEFLEPGASRSHAPEKINRR